MRRLLAPSLFALLVILIFRDPLFTGRAFAGRDLTAYNHPMEKQIHEAWRRGRLPVWYDQVSGGRPLAANPNAGALYPARVALAALPFESSVVWFPVLHWIAAGWGMAALTGSLGAGPAARWLAAITYVFSGVQMALVFLPNLHAGAALLPWVLWSVVRWPQSGRSGVWTTALLLGFDLLAGDVFTVGMAVGAAGLWLLLAKPEGRVLPGIARLAAACGLSLSLAAPLVVASLLWAPLTTRAVVGLDLGQALGFSLSPWRILELAIPYPFGATWTVSPAEIWAWSVFQGKLLGMFGTLFAGSFCLLAAARLRSDASPGARLALWLAGLGLALAVLPSFVPRSWLSLRSPVALRNPEKLAILLELGLAVAVGMAFQAGGLERLRRPALAAAAVLAALAALAAVSPNRAASIALGAVGTEDAAGRTEFAAANPRAIAAAALPAALAEAGVFWIATAIGLDLAGRASARSRILAAVVLGLVPVAASRRLPLVFSTQEAFAPSAFARMVSRADPQSRYRVLSETLFGGSSDLLLQSGRSDLGGIDTTRRTWLRHTQGLWNVPTVFNADFDFGDLYRLESLRKVAAQQSREPGGGLFFGDLSLRFGIRFRDQVASPGFGRIGGDTLQDWDENPSARPDVRWVERWKRADGPLAAWKAVSSEAGAIVLETAEENGRSSSRPASVRVVERSPERLRVEVDAADPGWLFVLRGFWPYRTVLVDAEPVRPVPAQVAFSAVAVPAGAHRIEWTEELPGWRLTRWGPVLFALGAAVLLRPERRPVARP